MGGPGNAYVALSGRFLGKPSLLFDDTEHASLQVNLIRMFGTRIFTPCCYRKDLGKNHVRYNGYHELAYLHPEVFKPDPSILKTIGVSEGERFTIIRFVKWQASHDAGHNGIHERMKIRAVESFSRFGKVFVSSEGELPRELECYRFRIPPERIFDVMFYASLLYGESATMASECSVLGTPSIYLDNNGRGYTDEQEKRYGLVHNFTESPEDQQRSIEKGIKILENYDQKHWKEQRKALLREKIDVTGFMMDVVKKYST